MPIPFNFSFWKTLSISPSSFLVRYLNVAGGGGGGGFGGGGAGGLLTGTTSISASSYSITVGNGGAGSIAYNLQGSNGGNSVFNGITTLGGGGGGGFDATGSGQYNGLDGGSGGGGGYEYYSIFAPGIAGLGTIGQGYDGGVASASQGDAGGGGGAGGIGGDGNGSYYGGDGGIGLLININSYDTYYAGGGGGAGYYSLASGGSGGGGTGGQGNSSTGPTKGIDNRGGGGGGSYANLTPNGAPGGSGVVIINYSAGTATGTGGIITTLSGYTTHKFIEDGIFTIGSYTPTNSLLNNISAYYKLDGNSNDSIGGVNGTDTSISYSTSYGIISSGASNGGIGSIDFPTNVAFDLKQNFTISLWFKRNGSQFNKYLISKRNTGLTDNVWSIVYGFTTDTIAFYCNSDRVGDNPYSLSNMTISDDNWHHIVYTYDDTNFRGYIDGVIVVDQQLIFELGISTPNLILFGRDSSSYIVDGYIDEIGIWKRGLTETEILVLYNSGIGLQYPF